MNQGCPSISHLIETIKNLPLDNSNAITSTNSLLHSGKVQNVKLILRKREKEKNDKILIATTMMIKHNLKII